MKHAWEARARELAHLHAVLAARRPALVVLTGAPGMGKTTLLETWAARATALGWEVAGGDASRRLAVESVDGRAGFRAALLAATCESRRRRAARSRPRHGLGSAGPPPHARSAAQRARAARAVSDRARRLLPEPAVRGVVRGRLPARAAALRCRGGRRARGAGPHRLSDAPIASWRSASSRRRTCTRRSRHSMARCLPSVAAARARGLRQQARVPAVLDSLLRVLALEAAA